MEVEVVDSVAVEDILTQAHTLGSQEAAQGIPADFLVEATDTHRRVVATVILHRVVATVIPHLVVATAIHHLVVVTAIHHQAAVMDIHRQDQDYQDQEAVIAIRLREENQEQDHIHTPPVVDFLGDIPRAINILIEEYQVVRTPPIPLSTTTTTTRHRNKSAMPPPLDSDRFLIQFTMALRRPTCINTKIQEVNTVLYLLAWHF